MNKLLLESGIRIPKGKHAAKIIYHQDLDGVFSAIAVYHQIINQKNGIKPENIFLSGIQYGDNNEKVKKQLSASKGQMVALVDYARIEVDGRRPDFWSDHHQPSEEIKKIRELIKKEKDPKKKMQLGKKLQSLQGKSGKIGADYKSDTEHITSSYARNIIDGKTIKAISIVDSAQYSDIDQILELPFDFKKESFKKFNKYSRMERLAIMTQAILADAGLYRNEKMLEYLIKTAKPSLLSVFNKAVELANLSDKQKKAINELGKENPDWELIHKTRKEMPTKEIAADIKNSKQSARSRLIKMTQDENKRKLDAKKNKFETILQKSFNLILEGKAKDRIEKIRTQRESSINKQTKKEETGFKQSGSLMKQNAGRVQRYLWTRLHEEGIRSPFVMKQIGPMIQVSVNPDLPEDIKEKVDLAAIAKEILIEVRNEIGPKQGWIMDIIEKESGGHKGITNVTGLHLFGLLPKEQREEMKSLQDYKNKIKKFKVLGTRKLPKDLREKKNKMQDAIKKIEKLDRYNEEESKILKQAAEDWGKVDIGNFNWTKAMSDAIQIINRQKILKSVSTQKKFKTYYADTKVHPNIVDNYEKYKKRIKILNAKFEEIMPKKAARLKELENFQNVKNKEKNKIINLIKDKFQIKLDNLAKDFIPLKGEEKYKIK